MNPKATLLLSIIAALILPACTTTQEPPSLKPTSTSTPPKPTTPAIVVTTPIVVTGTFDGKNKTYKAHKSLGDGSQKEGQKPLFILQPGATLKNVILDHPAADGVHIYTAKGKKNYLLNSTWLNVGEDAFTVYGDGELRVASCKFYHAADKVGQLNGPAKVTMEDCYAQDFGKLARGCGTCGNQAYNITVKNATARDGDNIIRLTNSKARGYLIGGKFTNVKEPAFTSGGAKIEIR